MAHSNDGMDGARRELSVHAAREMAQLRVALDSRTLSRRKVRRTARSIRQKDADGFYDGEIDG